MVSLVEILPTLCRPLRMRTHGRAGQAYTKGGEDDLPELSSGMHRSLHS